MLARPQEDIKQNAKDYSNYNLIISPFNQEYDYIDDWGSDFRYLGSGKLHASGYTETGKDVDNIRTTVYLQQYDDSNKTWVNVDSISNNQNNSSYSSTSQTYKVPEGFKYRLLIIHKATEGRVTESTSSYSSVINVY